MNVVNHIWYLESQHTGRIPIPMSTYDDLQSLDIAGAVAIGALGSWAGGYPNALHVGAMAAADLFRQQVAMDAAVAAAEAMRAEENE